MPRNLYNRVELVIPIEDEAVRNEMLESSSSACRQRRLLGRSTRRADGPAEFRDGDEPVCDVQLAMIERASSRAAEAAAVAP